MEEIRLENETAAEETQQGVIAEAVTEEVSESYEKRGLFASGKVRLIAILSAIVVVFAAVAIGVVSYYSPERVALRFFEAYIMDDIYEQEKYAAYDVFKLELKLGDLSEEEYFEEQSDELGYDIDNWKTLSKVQRELREEELEESFGESDITFEVSRTKERSVKKLLEEEQGWLELLEYFALFDMDSITAAKEITVKAKAKGEDRTERGTFLVRMVKIGSSWKGLDVDFIE